MAEWWRSWHGAPMDPKWIVVARRAGVSIPVVTAVVWALFDYASQHDDRGTVEGFDIETYGAWSGVDESEIRAVIGALESKGVIQDGRLTAWERRQPKREDDSRQRVAAYRERQRDSGNGVQRDVTQRNAPEQIQIQNRAEQRRTEKTEPRAARAPSSDQPYDLYLALCEVNGVDPASIAPAGRDKQLGIAKRLLEQGFGVDKTRRVLRYLRSQDWRTSAIDLGTVLVEGPKWELNGCPDQSVPKVGLRNGRGLSGADIAKMALEAERSERG